MSNLAVGCSFITLVWLTKSLAARYEILWIQFIKIVPILDHYIFSEQMEHTCSIKEIWVRKLLTHQPPPSPSVPLPRIKNSSWSHENKGRAVGHKFFSWYYAKLGSLKKNKEEYSGLDLLPSYLVACHARTQLKSNVHAELSLHQNSASPSLGKILFVWIIVLFHFLKICFKSI